MAINNFIIPTIKVVHNSLSNIYAKPDKVCLISYLPIRQMAYSLYFCSYLQLYFFMILFTRERENTSYPQRESTSYTQGSKI